MARPKSNPEAASDAPSIKATAPKIVKKPADFNKPKVYLLRRKGGIVYRISSDATAYDAENNTIRLVRYSPSEPSIYADEQSNLARREHIVFEDGILTVPVNKPNLSAFLDSHPDNVANGGNVFLLAQKEKEAEEEIEDEFLVHDAIGLVKNKEIQDLLPVAMFYGISTSQSNMEIRRELLKEAKGNPKRFIDSFDNPMVTTKAEILQAADFQIIKLAQEGVYWFDSNRLILSVPSGQDGADILTRYCLTEKGAVVHNAIKEKLAELS